MESVYPRKKRRAGERRQLDGYGGGQKTIRRPTIPGAATSDARNLFVARLRATRTKEDSSCSKSR